jgi:tetratricopeptide (TPR) repeat protein
VRSLKKSDPKLIENAVQLEDQSKIFLKNKNFDAAIESLMQAKELYENAGLNGQVSNLIKEIVKIKNLKDDFKSLEKKYAASEKKIELTLEDGFGLLNQARELTSSGQLEEAISFYNKAYDFFKSIKSDFVCRQVLWQINEIKEHVRWKETGKGVKTTIAIKDIVSLARAEERRSKIQNDLTSPKPKSSTFSSSGSNMKIDDSKDVPKPKLFQELEKRTKAAEEEKQMKEDILSEHKQQLRTQRMIRQEKLLQIQEQKKMEKETRTKAEELLDKGNLAVKGKNYDEAKTFYRQSIDLFQLLGWNDQIRVIENEIRNVDTYQREDEKKRAQEVFIRQKQEEQFKERVDKVMMEKASHQKKLNVQKDALPTEIKTIMDKIDLMKEKAQKEETSQNISRLISRYQLILNLYRSISSEIVDFSVEMSEVKNKIEELKGKL